MQIKVAKKGFEDLWAKSVRELSAEAMAADEIERNGNLDSNLEGMSTMDMESNSSYILMTFYLVWIWQFCVAIRFVCHIAFFITGIRKESSWSCAR